MIFFQTNVFFLPSCSTRLRWCTIVRNIPLDFQSSTKAGKFLNWRVIVLVDRYNETINLEERVVIFFCFFAEPSGVDLYLITFII